MSKIIWFLKQLLPLTYRSEYQEGRKKVFAVWNMWFGKVFNLDAYFITSKCPEQVP